MKDFAPVLNTENAELSEVVAAMAQGDLDGAIALWQGLIAPASFDKTDPSPLINGGLELLQRGDFEQRWLVSNGLLKLGEGIIPPVLILWQSTALERELRWFAGRLLGKFISPEITLALTGVFSQPQEEELWAIAAEGLSQQGELALTVVAALLQNGESRPLAVRILARLSHPGAIPLLQTLVTDGDPNLRAQALQALNQYPSDGLVPLLLQAIADPVALVRRQGVEGLGLYLKSLGQTAAPPPAGPILQELYPLLMDADPLVCEQTAIALSYYPTAPSIEVLANTLASPDTPEALRLTVIKCLGWMETPESLAALAAIFSHPCHGQSLPDLTLVIQTLGRTKAPRHQARAGEILLSFAQSHHPWAQNPELRKHLSQSWAQLHYLPARSLLQTWQGEGGIGIKLHAQAALKRLALP